jgi:hypothetical protein
VCPLTTYIATHDVAALILDPLTSVMDGRIDAHRDREVRTALEPLGKLAEETGASSSASSTSARAWGQTR